MSKNQDIIKGRCFCGEVQFRLCPPTEFVAHCHCRSCRLSHAAPFVTWTAVPKERFVFKTGESQIKWFKSSDWIEWGFCSNCGSQMLYRVIREGHPENPKPERMYVSAGSLVDPIDQEPAAHVSYEERALWCQHKDDLPKYRGKGEERMDQ